MQEGNLTKSIQKYKIVHLISDFKFANAIYDSFVDFIPVEHYWCCTGAWTNEQLALFKGIRIEQYDILKIEEPLIFCHSLNEVNKNALLLLPENIKIVWFGFGKDYQDYLYSSYEDQLLPQTKNLFIRLNYPNRYYYWLKKLKNHLHSKNRLKSELNIILFCPILIEEFDYKNPRKLTLSVSTLSHKLPFNKQLKIQEDAKNILIGNSSTFTNNHLDSFELIKNGSIGNSSVILPLSYGAGGEIYANHVAQKAYEKWGGAVKILSEFINKEDFIHILTSCKTAIFPYLRQQGLFSIHLMVFMGARVFMLEENPVYRFYQRIGVKVFSFSDLKKADIDYMMPLESNIADNNRRILNEYFSSSNHRKRMNLFLNELMPLL